MEYPGSYDFIADFTKCVVQIAGNAYLKVDENPRPNSGGRQKANHFLINVRNQVGQYIVLEVGKGQVESVLSGKSNQTNMMGVFVSPTRIESVWQLNNSGSNENAAYITGDNYPWEALDNVERRSRTRASKDDSGKMNYIWESPEMQKSRPNKRKIL